MRSNITNPVDSKYVRLVAIDGLRTLAVLSVIAYHFNIGLAPSGFIGVDIFFVISGYVISLSLIQNTRTSAFQYILAFYKRRILRIMPALIVCLVITGIVSLLFIPESWLSSSNNKTGYFAFFGLSNFALLSDQDGYFDARAEFNPFLHTWSLAVEEQFYLVFPLLFLFWLKAGLRKGFLAFIARYLILILGALSLAWAAFETTSDPKLAFYMLPSRFWELAAGAALFQCHSSNYCIPRGVFHARLLAILGILLLALSIVWTDHAGFPFPWALATVGGTVVLICVARSPAASNLFTTSVLKNPVVVYLGRSSYSLYLWHWPVVVLLQWTVGFEKVELLALALVLTLMLGTASYELVEKPFLTSKSFRSLPALQIVSTGVVLTVGIAVGFKYGVSLYSQMSLSIVEKESGWHSGDLPSFENSLLTNSSNSSKSSPTLWIVGDSHAGAYGGMARRVAAQESLTLRIKTLSGCPVANLRQSYPDIGYCRDYLERLMDELSRNSSAGDIVFLASLRGQRISNQWQAFDSDKLNKILYSDRSQRYHKALEQTRNIIRKLLSLGLTIIIDTPKPVFRAPPFRCSDWFNHMNPVCRPGFVVPANELKTIDAPVLDSLQTLKVEFPSLVVWDPFPILCPGSICSAFRDGRPLFFDQDHLSGYGNQLLLQSFSELLQGIIKPKVVAGADS